MPRNFKEALIFTTMMCGMMVLGMSIWNLVLVDQFSWSHLAMGYLPGFVTAFLLDVLIVGPLVKVVAFKFLKDHHKRWQKIVTISGGMALLMVTFMSLYGLLYNHVPISLTTYLGAWGSNFIMALPLNFLIVGPLHALFLDVCKNHFQEKRRWKILKTMKRFQPSFKR